jgi:ubiquinone/menaquinone biosynthesis C-methylase UbiE
MNHADHVALLRGGLLAPGGMWADLGSGTGAFTLALAELIGPTGCIYSVDRDRGALKTQESAMRARFPGVGVQYLAADFTQRLDLPALDGVVMANSLHFHRDKAPILGWVYSYLKPGGALVIIEYNTDRGNTWVPYPFSYPNWERLARGQGFAATRLLATRPSRFLGEIYSALSSR